MPADREYNFTIRVRKILAHARAEAERCGHATMSPEHVVLGLIEDGGGVAFAILENHGMSTEALRRDVEASLPLTAPEHSTLRDLPWTPVAKNVLMRAMTEARELRHSYVGTEHLLLALVHDPHLPVAKLLAQYGLLRETAMAETLRLLGPMPPSH